MCIIFYKIYFILFFYELLWLSYYFWIESESSQILFAKLPPNFSPQTPIAAPSLRPTPPPAASPPLIHAAKPHRVVSMLPRAPPAAAWSPCTELPHNRVRSTTLIHRRPCCAANSTPFDPRPFPQYPAPWPRPDQTSWLDPTDSLPPPVVITAVIVLIATAIGSSLPSPCLPIAPKNLPKSHQKTSEKKDWLKFTESTAKFIQ